MYYRRSLYSPLVLENQKMIAVISDIHSNIEALQAVLDDIASRDIKRIFCLGDVIGYGPDPCQCLDMIMEHCEVTLMGNHDYAVMYEPSNFNIGAESACFWTRKQLEAEPDDDLRAKRWGFLGQLPVKHSLDLNDMDLGVVSMVHGSPRRPINEYIFPDDIYNNPNKMRTLFDRTEHICFVGHTHTPGAFFDTPDFYSPEELDWEFEIEPEHKVIVNVGSVGQPRDRDPRAAYVILEPGLVRFVRVEYDLKKTVEKVKAIKELDDYLGIRLAEGR